MELVFASESPRTPDVASVLARHLAFAREVTPICHVHALDVDGLCAPGVTLFVGRLGGDVVAVGALRDLDASHCELKSMHVLESQRGNGAGRALLEHLLSAARDRGYSRVSLETGTPEAFIPARHLYETVGFRRCAPFGEYTDNPHSVCMTMELARDGFVS